MATPDLGIGITIKHILDNPPQAIQFFYKQKFLVIIIIGIILFGSLYSTKRRRRALSKLFNNLNGFVSIFSFIPTFKGTYEGLKFSISLTRGDDSRPPYLIVALFKNSNLKINVCKKSFLNKQFLKREIKINDERFNNNFLVYSNKPDEGLNYFRRVEIKDAIVQLFNQQPDKLFGEFSIDGKKILIKIPNYNLGNDIQPSIVEGILQKLRLLAQELPI